MIDTKMIPHPTIPRYYIIEDYFAFQEIFMTNTIPKPDFTNINNIPISIDNTPKVYQKGMIIPSRDNLAQTEHLPSSSYQDASE